VYNMHSYFHNAGEHFIVCIAVVNCPAAAVTKRPLHWLAAQGRVCWQNEIHGHC